MKDFDTSGLSSHQQLITQKPAKYIVFGSEDFLVWMSKLTLQEKYGLTQDTRTNKVQILPLP